MIQILILVVIFSVLFIILLFYIFNIVDILVPKDAPFVPASPKIVAHILELAKLKPNNIFIDLGCGDGRFLIEAEQKYQVESIGYEKGIVPFIFAKINIWHRKSKAKILFKDIFSADLRKADVVFCYLKPKILETLEKKFAKELKKGARVITLVFQLPNKQELRSKTFSQITKLNQLFIYQY